eukprot:13963004-Alexandrium_andersonii.AAC.1
MTANSARGPHGSPCGTARTPVTGRLATWPPRVSQRTCRTRWSLMAERMRGAMPQRSSTHRTR